MSLQTSILVVVDIDLNDCLLHLGKSVAYGCLHAFFPLMAICLV